MYTYKDVSYTDDQIKKAAEQSNMTVKEYLKKIKGDKDPEPKIKHSDLLDPNFQQDAAAGADVVSQPMTASQAGVTDSPSEDISLESPKTKEDLKLDNINKTLSKAGSSIWNYSPDNISDLYLKTTGKGVEYQTINTPSILGLGGPGVKYTGIFGDHSSAITGGFSYDDFAQNEKINGVSIAELQAEDQNKAANSALNVIIKKYGDKSNDFVLNQGGNILKGADKELKTLYSSLKTVSDKDKQSILDKIQEIRNDESRELYNINTGDLVQYKDLSEEDKKQENSRSEKATEIAKTTELSKIQDQLTKSYSNLVGISNRISDFIKENGEEEITKESQTGPAIISNVVKDFFGSEETVYGDLERAQQIASTNELPENISKINGNHPLAKAYNTALENYVVLNKAIQTNTDPLSKEQEGFWFSAGQNILEKIDMTGGDAMPKPQYTINRAFVKEAKKAGLGGINDEYLDEALSQNWLSVVGGGTVDLTMFVGELMLFKGAGGNKIQKGFKLLDKSFKSSKAAKSSKVLRKAGDFVIKGLDEAAVFTGLETTKTTLGLSQQATREQEWATATFGFSLGGGNSLGSGLLRAIPSKTIFSPVMAQLSKSDVLKDVGGRFVNASAGAFSFEFATVLEAIQNPEGIGYGPRGESTYFEQSPEEFILHYLGETAKMALLGTKSAFSKNGILAAAQRDMRLLNLNPAYVNKAAKITGIDAESVRKPGEETINEIDAARAEKMAGIDAKLKTQQITEEQAKKEAESANKNYNILEAEAELNLAKERFEAEDKSALKPTDESVRILIQKMKKGEKFNDKDNNALVNTPLPIIYARMGANPSSKSLDGLWNREFVIEDILNNNISFKAGYGTKERAESYKFIDEYFEIGGKVKALENIKNKNQGQEKELESLTKDLEAYNPGGYKYDKLQDKLDQYYLKQRQENKAQAEDVLGATKEGESVSIRSVDDFQKKYEEVFDGKEDVKQTDGFYDPNNKVYYVNEAVVKETRNITVDKHEAGHFVLRDSFKDKTGNVTEEGIKLIDDVLNELTPKQKELVQKRIDDNYRYDSKGKELDASKYYEEYLTVLSDAITEKSIVFKENVGNAMEKFVPFLRKKGMPELELNADTGKNLFELIKSYSKGEEKGIQAAKDISIAAEGVQVEGQKPSKSISRRDSDISPKGKQYIDLFKEGLIENEQLVDIINSPSSKPEEKFGAIDAIVEANWPVISNSIKFNPTGSIPIESVKTAVKEQLQGIFPGRNKEFLKDFDAEKSKVTTVLGPNFLGRRQAEILERAKNIGEKKLDGTSTDSEQAKQIVDTSTKTSVAVDKLAKKPTETTKFKSNYISPEFKKSLDTNKSEKQAIEDKISSTVKESFKDRSVSRFKETGKIPQELAQLYADMFGIKTVSALIEKQRNLQKLDQQGAVRARQFLIDNAASDFARLPRSKDDTGKATGILQTKIGKVLYNKAGELTGGLKTYTDIIKGKNVTLEGYDGKQYEFNQLDSEGKKKPIYRDAQHIKAALDFHIRNRALETLIPEQGKRIQAGAKFQKRKESGQAKLDSKVDKKALNKIRTDRVAKQKVLVNTFPKFLPVDRFARPTNWTSGNKISSLRKRGFDIISDPRRIVDKKLRTEAEQAILNDELINLTKVKEDAKKNERSFNDKELEAFKESFRGKNGPSWKKNLQLKKLHDKGVDLQIDAELAIAKTGPEDFAVLREYIYNPSLNANANRNQATAIGREVGALERKKETTDEHVFQAIEHANIRVQLYKNIIEGKPNAKQSLEYYKKWIKDNYIQYTLKNENDTLKGNLVDSEGNKWSNSGGTSHPVLMKQLNKAVESGKKEDWDKVPSSDLRYFNTYKNAKNEYVGLNPNNIYKGNETKAKEYNVVVPKKFEQNKNVVIEQNKIMESVILSEAGLLEGLNTVTRSEAKGLINEYVKLADVITKATLVNNENTPKILRFSKKVSNEESLENLSKIDKALSIARNLKSPVKKIRVFDFDDTLATTKSNVLYEMPDGKKGSLTATEFAKRAGELEAKGAEWDFSEFSKVMKGAKGPLFDVAKFISESPGKRDMFVLTARPADAAGPIKEFLDSMGLNIPLENITGLGDGTPQAKARWMIDKAADGYNDFYFADDHLGNVRAVKEILSVVDVKSKVQQAKFSKKLGKTFNDIIQEKTGIASEKTFGSAKAEIMGKGKGRFDIFISPTAEDFAGLLYKTLPKGKKGEQALKFYKENLFDPFARAEDNIIRDQISLANDVKALKNKLGIIPKKLRKKNETGFTNEQALRVRMWTKMGVEVPGLSKSDLAELNKVIKDNPTYEAFANELLSTTKGDGWAEPGKNWLSGTLTSDARTLLGKVKRAKYLEQWKQNKDEIFSEANLNKLEAAYGKKYRKALEGTLERMQSGKNRSSQNTAGDRALDYINNSVGAIMFLNTRSAVLQTLSSINFINWTDNNPLKASARLVDVKQYSKDFLEIMNSDYLTARRDGLKLNVSEAEIAADSGARGIINTILKKGFVFTKYADSFAIASGGATFYRNRINTYKKQGLSEVEAKEKAFLDFKDISEKSQQSSGTDKISQQQASNLGRVVLAFANTPMQYARLQKKAMLDLANKRGDWRENTSKIVYYGFVQNLIFNVVQNALFGLAFADDEQDEKLLSKSGRVANGMADSLLRGTGIPGAITAQVKNALMVINSESSKKNPKYSKAVKEIVSISPTVGSKYKKLVNASKAAEYGAFDDMKFSLDNPAYMAMANVISATTNIPVDRALRKSQNIQGALNEDYDVWERIAMAAGWQDWELGIEKNKKSKKKKTTKKKKRSGGITFDEF